MRTKIEAAFCRSHAGYLGRIGEAGLHQVLVSAGSHVEPFIAAALLDLLGDESAFVASVVGELACWKLGRTCCCRSVHGCSTEMGKGFPWLVSRLPTATTAEGWYVTPGSYRSPTHPQPPRSADFPAPPAAKFLRSQKKKIQSAFAHTLDLNFAFCFDFSPVTSASAWRFKHILLGLLREGEGIAARVLTSLEWIPHERETKF